MSDATRRSIVAAVILCTSICCAVDFDCPPMDLTGDCYVDMNDVKLMAEQWLQGPVCPVNYEDCDANELNACESHLLTDYRNCGSCGYTCEDFPGTYCLDGNCVPFNCPDLWADCDGNPNNGCEFDLSYIPNTCATAYDIGSIRGDVGSDQIQYSDHGSMYLLVRVTEANDTIAPLSVRFDFDCPPDAEYRIKAWDITSTGQCQFDYIILDGTCGTWGCLCRPDTYDPHDDGWYVIQIQAISGSVCSDWTLTVTGNTCPNPQNCPPPPCPYGGTADCDGLETNGCEVDIGNHMWDCNGAPYIGAVSGDTGSDVIDYSGRGDATLEIYVAENSSAYAYLIIGVSLSVPSGVDYDVCIYDHDGCSLMRCFSQSGSDSGCVCWPDTSGSDDGKTIIIRVSYDSGSSCEDWQLTVTGNVACSFCEP